MSLVECHIDQAPKAPLPVMEVERQEIKELVEEYEDVFTSIAKLKGRRGRWRRADRLVQ